MGQNRGLYSLIRSKKYSFYNPFLQKLMLYPLLITTISMDSVFELCVHILVVMAKALGMTYNEINIWIFVIIEPLIFILMCFWIYYLYRVIRKLKKRGGYVTLG